MLNLELLLDLLDEHIWVAIKAVIFVVGFFCSDDTRSIRLDGYGRQTASTTRSCSDREHSPGCCGYAQTGS